ncbi:MAG: GNAT family N-acetyltransferase, partial [Coleofasciculus sp. Co-bin14]|nr:GNAT family N-acetyltransferase [Coleofasciculus sp. Co-bin14]
VNWQKHHFGVWAVVYKCEQKLIGHCGFKFLDNTGEIQIGYLLLQAYWGRGLATEAAEAALHFGFEVARLERIVAIAKPENIASIGVMKKRGMNYEKYAYYYNNKVDYYSIAREDYLSTSRLFNNSKNLEKISSLLIAS